MFYAEAWEEYLEKILSEKEGLGKGPSEEGLFS